MSRLPALLLPVLAAALPGAARPATPPQVTIYRCTDAAGRLSLRDSPCRHGERQEVRSMLRPTDPPRAPAAPAPRPTRTVDATGAQPRIVYVTPPRPTYECTTPDGNRYTSDSPEGNPRWVPLWTLGYAVAPGYTHGGYGGRIEYRDRGTAIRIDGGRRWHGPDYRQGAPALAAVPAGMWIRDTCRTLPPAEACARLRDRRSALDRRYYSSLQSERREIVAEQRVIDARLSGECRG